MQVLAAQNEARAAKTELQKALQQVAELQASNGSSRAGAAQLQEHEEAEHQQALAELQVL